MPTPKNEYDREQIRRIDAIQKQIDAIYDEAVREAAALGVTINMPQDAEKMFSFDDYPRTQKRVKEMLENLRSQLQAAIVNAVRSSWTLANNKNNELCNVVFGNNVGKLTEEQYRRYYSTNGAALDAFIQRKENGMNLSDRVWHYSDLFKREIEMGLDLGIRSGLDAPAMARDLKQYLRHPDKLFRRVRDEHGNLQLSKAAADFHPGRGVYRSSYLNARRLAATETNIAYRTADHERWKKMDFVVGIEIHLSNNHTCKGRDGKPHPFTDICDDLKGKYPKDFKFTGWHPHCRCFATSILKTDEEIAEDTKKILRGEPVTGVSENTVEDVPEGFKDWLKDNKERAKTHYSVPYFLKDNMKYVPKELIDSYSSRMPYDTYAEYEAAMKYNKKHSKLTKEQMANVRELNKVMPVVQGKIMTISEADNSNVNPNYDRANLEYSYNCATCVPAYLLRKWGYKINAGKYTAGSGIVYELSQRGLKAWKRQDGTTIDIGDDDVKTWSKWVRSHPSVLRFGIKEFAEDNVREAGTYLVRLKWKKSGAHFTVIERDKSGNLFYYDPQSGNKNWMRTWENSCDMSGCWLMRIDDKIIDTNVSGAFAKEKKHAQTPHRQSSGTPLLPLPKETAVQSHR